MNHDVAIIEQHPTAVRLPFNRKGQPFKFFFHTQPYRVRQRFCLTITVGAANDEVVGNNRFMTQIEQQNFACFFVL